MTGEQELRHGDFTTLAADYSRYRSAYAPAVLSAVLGLLGRDPSFLDAVDVGAGTGLWTRMLARAGFRSVTAVEPNDAMRTGGENDSVGHGIVWRSGKGEATGLPGCSADLLTMASSFHWVDFERGSLEFCRVLRPAGWFVALWNPRLPERNPLLLEIEQELDRLKPDLRRVSSGRSGFTERLTDRLEQHPGFDEVVTLECRQVVEQSADHYLGAWRSVNDVRVQLGEKDFDRFLVGVRERLADVSSVRTTYLTRAWAARRAD
jgi:SAM-dependent methyltransferase